MVRMAQWPGWEGLLSKKRNGRQTSIGAERHSSKREKAKERVEKVLATKGEGGGKKSKTRKIFGEGTPVSEVLAGSREKKRPLTV